MILFHLNSKTFADYTSLVVLYKALWFDIM